jgi:hypothetical protein
MMLVILGSALVASACGHESMERMSMYGERMTRHVSALEIDVDLHRQAMSTMPALDDATSLEWDHHSRGLEHLRAMRYDAIDMMACASPDGTFANPAIVMFDLGRMEEEIDLHRAAMEMAATMTGAHAEEARHQEAMETLMAAMRTRVGTMMAASAGYMCPRRDH